jgi:hypothetical protein
VALNFPSSSQAARALSLNLQLKKTHIHALPPGLHTRYAPQSIEHGPAYGCLKAALNLSCD